MPELDVIDSLDKAIDEFHKLREDSLRLLERARWPDVKAQAEPALSPDGAPSPRGNAD